MALIREALRTRYSFLPFWYTQFYETEVTGECFGILSSMKLKSLVSVLVYSVL